MKIAFVTDKSSPMFVGGYENRIMNLATTLSRHAEVRVFTSLEVESLFIGGSEFIKISPTIFNKKHGSNRSTIHTLLFSIFTLRNPFKFWRPDFVIITSIPYIHLLPLWLHLRLKRIKVILDIYEIWNSYYDSGLKNWKITRKMINLLMRIGLSYASAVLFISHVTSNAFDISFRNFVGRRLILPLGVDEVLLKRIRDNTDVSASPKYDFISLGRLDPIKGVEEFIKGLYKLKQMRDWEGKAAVLGSGSDLKKLKSLVHSLHLDDSVDFFGNVSEDIKFQTLLQSKVYVLCSSREGFSLSTLEALYCGVPAIVAVPENREVFGVSDLVKEGVNGFYYTKGDINELACTMQKMISHDSLWEKLSLNSINLSKKYTWNNLSNELLKFLKSIKG